MAQVFVNGGTGYLGRALIQALLDRGHSVRALVRPGSESRVPARCEVVVGDALDASTFANKLKRDDVFVHLLRIA